MLGPAASSVSGPAPDLVPLLHPHPPDALPHCTARPSCRLTVSHCHTPAGVSPVLALDLACPKKVSEMLGPAGTTSACGLAGGTCSLHSDGFYRTSSASLAVGVLLGVAYVYCLPALMHLPLSRWRATAAGPQMEAPALLDSLPGTGPSQARRRQGQVGQGCQGNKGAKRA